LRSTEEYEMSDKTEYYKMRMEQTIKHNQEFTRLIYLVNAGILAFLAFLWKEVSPNYFSLPNFKSLAFWLTITSFASLIIINIFHALFIKRQGIWYRELKDSYWKLICRNKNNEITKELKSKFKHPLLSTTQLLIYIHVTVAASFLITLVMFLIYGRG
jgi:hypothetical protein